MDQCDEAIGQEGLALLFPLFEVLLLEMLFFSCASVAASAVVAASAAAAAAAAAAAPSLDLADPCLLVSSSKRSPPLRLHLK